MENSKEIREYDKVKYSDKDMWWASTKIAIAAFFLTSIFFRFETVEKTQGVIKQSQTDVTNQVVEAIQLLSNQDSENVEYLNERVDKKTKRIEEDAIKIWAEIEKLKLPNTDKNK